MAKDGKWTAEQIPNQAGRIAIVTGANSGIGFETARALGLKGATVVMACRNRQKAEIAAEQIRALISSNADSAGVLYVEQLDLGDLDSVRKFAAAFRKDRNHLDLLINNAGIMMPPFGKTAQGFETQIGVNHLGHFALTGLLIDLLTQTPESRVVTVSSGAHTFGQIDFDNLNWEHDYSRMRAYGQSKLANLLFTYELQRRLTAAGEKTLSVAAHPGWTETNLQAHSRMMRLLNPVFAQAPPMGALPTLYAATARDVNGGQYFGPGGFREMRGHPKQVQSNDHSHNEGVAARLWEVSEQLTGVRYVQLDKEAGSTTQ